MKLGIKIGQAIFIQSYPWQDCQVVFVRMVGFDFGGDAQAQIVR